MSTPFITFEEVCDEKFTTLIASKGKLKLFSEVKVSNEGKPMTSFPIYDNGKPLVTHVNLKEAINGFNAILDK